ncbi:MAG: PQQ-binding-like beta-propeller repeat protein, partial [Acidobacteriota bacterium]
MLFASRFGLKLILPGFDGFSKGMMGSFAFAAVLVLWWLFFSRAAWLDRFAGLALIGAAIGLAWQFKHASMGPLWLVGYAVPGVCLALVVWAAATRHWEATPRRAAMVVVLLVAGGVWTLFRTEGIDGDHNASFAWRWSATAEQQLLADAVEPTASTRRSTTSAEAAPEAAAEAAPETAAETDAETETDSGADAEPAEAEWPGFRGAARTGIVATAQITTDWSTSPPTELWRRPIGPAWSSFAVDGDRLYTQEQRGDDEAVSAYDATTGDRLWSHLDPVRFFESNAGAGPRATPTLTADRVVAFGATGLLNVLAADDGRAIWSTDVAADLDLAIPDWGFSSSPLVLADQVVVAAAGQLVAYDLASGDRRWSTDADATSYSSPHPVTLDGVEQVLLPRGAGLISVSPQGTVLWEHEWPGFPMTQPAVTAGGDLLLTASSASGVRRLAPRRAGDAWQVEERWTSIRLKPYFNDFVVHGDQAYGFDGRILACIEIADGQRCWKGGRYGNGQLILLADQDLLLVLTEKGELALVRATPERF